MNPPSDTIAAVATPPGKGGIGIIRVSGPEVKQAAERILGKLPKPRLAEYLPFYREQDKLADMGIALYFPGPNSLTGEDVLELQGHGGPVVLDLLLQEIFQLGIRPARPGEFLERAFINGKMDLAQAEAVADLIESASSHAAELAIRNLQGDFSHKINILQEELGQVRMYVEAAIDFPEEEIDFLQDQQLRQRLDNLQQALNETLSAARQGEIYQEGIRVVIAGRPNAGKSTLLNRLSGKDSAIISDIAGTTRDVIQVDVNLSGVRFTFADTAGLREGGDVIEEEGIRRARQQIHLADAILYVVDASQDSFSEDSRQLDLIFQPLEETDWAKSSAEASANNKPLILVLNKNDLSAAPLPARLPKAWACFQQVQLSSLTGAGMENLQSRLLDSFGIQESTEGVFISRRRHVLALQQAQQCVQRGIEQLRQAAAGELLAEELRVAQQFLSEITGEHSSDDLLADIFSQFCIGK